jgi:hypothetical protein
MFVMYLNDKEMQDIKTEFFPKPIPIRSFDWEATRDGYDEGDLIGYGETKADAVQNLLDLEAE